MTLQRWTEADDELLMSLWGQMSDRQAATMLGRTVCACKQRAYLLGISYEDNEWMAQRAELVRALTGDGRVAA